MADDQLPAFNDTVPVTDEAAAPNLPAFEHTEPIKDQSNPDVGIKTGNEELPAFENTHPVADEGSNTDFTKYETPTQQAITALEGAAQGATFGLSNYAETALGFTTEKDIAARQEANPGMHMAGEIGGTVASTFIPLGEGWLLAKAGSKIANKLFPIAKEAGKMAKIGKTVMQAAVRGGIETAGMQSGDELGKALIGKGNSADAVAMHIVGAGALGMCVGGVLGAGGQAYREAADAKVGEYLENFSSGIGYAKEGKAADIIKNMEYFKIPKGVKHGITAYQYAQNKSAAKIAEYGVGALGYLHGGIAEGGILYQVMKKGISPYTEKLVSKISKPFTQRVLAPVMIRAIDLGTSRGVSNALEYAGKAALGETAINKAINATLKKGPQEVGDYIVSPEHIEKMDDWVDQGGINQDIKEMQAEPEQAFAKGGAVRAKPLSNGMANFYPDQNIQLSAAKGRLSNYLTSLKPQKPMGMPTFDNPYHDKSADKTYRNALSIAIKPLSVLKKVQNGTIKAEDVKHLTSMYPEVHDLLARKMTEVLVQHQIDGKKPDSKTLQGISLLLGTALKSEMTPQGIQAAQASFTQQPMNKGQAEGNPNKPKKKTGTLENFSKPYETRDQARDARANKN